MKAQNDLFPILGEIDHSHEKISVPQQMLQEHNYLFAKDLQKGVILNCTKVSRMFDRAYFFQK